MPACVLPPAPEPVVMPPAEGDPDA
jgi:hypothetical protein